MPVRRLVLLSVCLLVFELARPGVAGALSNCKAKISTSATSPGEIQVQAKGVTGPITWGTAAGRETEPCGAPRKGNVCPLGASGTLAAETAPATCHLYLKDTAASCAVRIKSCSPGVRIRDASFASDDPRVESVSLEDDGATLRFTGVNLQVVSGGGATYGDVNGRGNLIVGYNEPKQCQLGSTFIGSVCDTDADCNGGAPGNTCVTMDRSGSHNLVVGSANGYSSYGGYAVGFGHSIEAPWCATAGIDNRASQSGAIVSGGTLNTASGLSATVSGGEFNTASGPYATVAAGKNNLASQFASSVSGGDENQAIEFAATVGGGFGNEAAGNSSWVGGGSFNRANATYSSVSGGICNIAGLGALFDPGSCFPSQSDGFGGAVTGGWRNQATGGYSTVAGGQDNTASGGSSSISGGQSLTQAAGFGWSGGSTGTIVSGAFSSP